MVYEKLADRVDIITDFEVGADRIDISGLLNSLSYTGSDPIADGYVIITGGGFLSQVRIDPDGATGPARAKVLALLWRVSKTELENAANFVF